MSYFLWNLIFLLMLRVYAECPDDSIVLYVDPEADYGGDGR